MFISQGSKHPNFWLREAALLILCILSGTVLAGIISQFVVYITKVDLNLVNFDFLSDSHRYSLAWKYRLLLSINHLCIFILPAIAYFYFTKYDFNILNGSVQKFNAQSAIIAVLILLAIYPIVAFSSEVNQSIALPTVLKTMEDQTNRIVKLLLWDKSVLAFIANITIIGILPAIGEELLFRGCIQSLLGKWLRKPELAIWVTAILFSAMHFQFEGFLPRMILGVALGYLFFWSGNILYPIFAHLFNNAMQVIIYHFYSDKLGDIDQLAASKISLPALLISVLILFLSVRWFKLSLHQSHS
jgi:membrane protease YdiL (CAAX protease family)